ncbi:hypothetical protein [Flavihumibacter petaseus]|uniref:ATP synthase subunit I n=1 Tax=Flavihumibacter petaseus NBRC 106054 TaxID=1220578 RepID=A0A0E9MZV5_9BACT|nr:hypothetical protein [Flavihumibacter petaseus]GAO43287.1 hypothetical protein FPE01S_02_03920 [Flavihumibacter petaseus NBRC 106054]
MEIKTPARKTALLPLIVIFLLVNVVLMIWNKRLTAMGVDVPVLQVGNLVLFLLFLLSGLMYRGSSNTTQAFLRPVYGGMMLKLFGGVIAAFIYIYVMREKVNKPALFGCMFLYVLYSALELRTLLKKNPAH